MTSRVRAVFLAAIVGTAMSTLILSHEKPGRYQAPESPDDIVDFAYAAHKLLPSVARIKALVRVDRTDERAGLFSKAKQSATRLFWDSYKEKSMGSGIVLNRRGYILTNNHVIEGADIILVKARGADQLTEAELVGADPMTDLALIRIRLGHGLIPARFGDSSTLEPGQWVAAIGHPMNMENSLSAGVVSALERDRLGLIDIEDFIQTDAMILPGNSGGPLCDISGKVIGVNTAVFGIGYGIGFAIPSNVAKRVLTDLARYGRVMRGVIGIRAMSAPEGLPGDGGALVVDMSPGGPADLAGIRRGDVIVSYNGRRVDNPEKLRRSVLESVAGETVLLKILRDGKPITLKVIIGAPKPVTGYAGRDGA